VTTDRLSLVVRADRKVHRVGDFYADFAIKRRPIPTVSLVAVMGTGTNAR
jgi:hypothetical protein